MAVLRGGLFLVSELPLYGARVTYGASVTYGAIVTYGASVTYGARVTHGLSSISAAVARFEGSKLSIGVRKSANFCAAAASMRYCKTVEGVRFGRFRYWKTVGSDYTSATSYIFVQEL